MSDTLKIFIEKIKRTDFETLSDNSIPNLSNRQIIGSLIDFFENHFQSKNNTSHYLTRLIVDCTHDEDDFPIIPTKELKLLGTLLHLAMNINGSVHRTFKNRFSRKGANYYENTLFELFVGTKIMDADPDIEFYEILSAKPKVDDYRKRLGKNKCIWIEIYKRDSSIDSKIFWQTEPHSENDYEEILMKFVEKTCKKMKAHFKKGNRNPDDINILVVRISDSFMAKDINYQLFVNDLPAKTVLVKYDKYQNIDGFIDDWEVYFQEPQSIENNDKSYIQSLFK